MSSTFGNLCHSSWLIFLNFAGGKRGRTFVAKTLALSGRPAVLMRENRPADTEINIKTTENMNENNTLTRDMQLVAEVIGEQAALKLMSRLGGVSIYIPRPGAENILNYLRGNGMDVKATAAQLGVSQSKVYRVMKEHRENCRDL